MMVFTSSSLFYFAFGGFFGCFARENTQFSFIYGPSINIYWKSKLNYSEEFLEMPLKNSNLTSKKLRILDSESSSNRIEIESIGQYASPSILNVFSENLQVPEASMKNCFSIKTAKKHKFLRFFGWLLNF